jgi:hypothetical protein
VKLSSPAFNKGGTKDPRAQRSEGRARHPAECVEYSLVARHITGTCPGETAGGSAAAGRAMRSSERLFGATTITLAMAKPRYALVELAGRDPDDWPELTPEDGRKFERQLSESQNDDLLDGTDLDGEHFFVHARDVKRVTYW